jgi:hypothetical protein
MSEVHPSIRSLINLQENHSTHCAERWTGKRGTPKLIYEATVSDEAFNLLQ